MKPVRTLITIATVVCTLCAVFPLSAQFGAGDSSGQSNTKSFQEYSLKHQSPSHLKKLLSGLVSQFETPVQVLVDDDQKLLLVKGPAEAHEITRQLIVELDQPGVMPKPVVQEKAQLETYRCRLDAVKQAQQLTRELLANDSKARISIDEQSGMLLVLAPPASQAKVQKLLQGKQFLLNAPKQPAGAPAELIGQEAPPFPAEDWVARQNMMKLMIDLKHQTATQVQAGLIELLGNRLQRTVPAEQNAYSYKALSGVALELNFRTNMNQIELQGHPLVVKQFSRLVGFLDTPGDVNELKVRVIPVSRSKPETVRKALQAYLKGYRTAEGKKEKGTSEPESDPQSFNLSEDSEIEQVNFQEEGGAAANPFNQVFEVPGNELDQALDAQDEERLKSRLGELSQNVQIQTLDDLDLIILRGRDQDVDEISRIIEQIEQLSEEAEPEVEIITLKHVSGQSLAQLTVQLNQQFVGGRQGRVQVTPLVKPNALVLIGWGEAFQSVKVLIEKLDQPVDPESELQVFHLKHAAAVSTQQTIQQFFSPQGGLSPQVSIIADIRTNSLIVRAVPRDMKQVKALVTKLDVAGTEAVNQVRTFKLRFTKANDLNGIIQRAINAARGQGPGKSKALELLTVDANGRQLLKSGVLHDVELTPDPRTNSLIVSAPEESMELLEALIKQLDREPEDKAQIKVFRIVNGDAEALIRMLRSLLPSNSGPNLQPQLPGASGESSLIGLRFSLDERTNSIIASGSAGDLSIIEALLLRLDEKEVRVRKNNVYRLKNAPAAKVATAIIEFLTNERKVRQATSTSENPYLQIEHEVNVVAEPESNSVIISALPEYYEEIMELIKKLDEQPPMVMMQVLIAELALNDVDEFGVELGIQDSLLFDRSLLGDLVTTTNTTQFTDQNGVTTTTEEIIQAASNTPGFNFNSEAIGNSGSDSSLATAGAVAGQAISNFDMGRVNSQLGFGGLVLSAGSENINVLIRALKDSRRLEVLSRPQVMALNNQSAFIQVGQKVPYIINTTFSTFGQVNSVELKDVGLIMMVKPRISPDGNVVMEIDAEKSEVGDESEGITIAVNEDGEEVRQPRINVTTASTTVSADNGETIILGGLITKSTAKTTRRVPYLADIPLMGDLFRYDGRLVRRTELLIILTPYVINGPEDMDRMRQIEEARMNWCAADVAAINSMIGYDIPESGSIDQDMTVIFPDENPRGEFPEPHTMQTVATTGGTANVSQMQMDPKLRPISAETEKKSWWRKINVFSKKEDK